MGWLLYPCWFVVGSLVNVVVDSLVVVSFLLAFFVVWFVAVPVVWFCIPVYEFCVFSFMTNLFVAFYVCMWNVFLVAKEQSTIRTKQQLSQIYVRLQSQIHFYNKQRNE